MSMGWLTLLWGGENRTLFLSWYQMASVWSGMKRIITNYDNPIIIFFDMKSHNALAAR